MIVNRHVSRLEAFSDAIFGFAATLLVVDLDAPTTYAALVANVNHFVAFALSFATLVLLWAVHNGFFRRYELEDAGTIVLNAIFLFLIVFYVYPLKFAWTTFVGFTLGGVLDVPRVPMTRDALAGMFAIYGVGWTAAFAAIAMLHLHAWRRRDALGLDRLAAFDAITLARYYGMFVLTGLVSVALATAQVGVPYGVPGHAYFLLGPLCWWNGTTRARARARVAASSDERGEARMTQVATA